MIPISAGSPPPTPSDLQEDLTSTNTPPIRSCGLIRGGGRARPLPVLPAEQPCGKLVFRQANSPSANQEMHLVGNTPMKSPIVVAAPRECPCNSKPWIEAILDNRIGKQEMLNLIMPDASDLMITGAPKYIITKQDQNTIMENELNTKNSTQRKEILFRRLEGKRRKEKFLKKIESLLEDEIKLGNFFSLEKSDCIANAIATKTKKTTALKFPSFHKLIAHFRKELIGNEFYILIDLDWKYCGIYKAEIKSTYKTSYDFIELGVDDIEIIATDLSFGIHIEYYHDSVIDTYKLMCELIDFTTANTG